MHHQAVGHDSIAAYLRVNIRHQKLAGSTDLLLLGLYLGTRNHIPQDNPLSMKLCTASLVCLQVINGDKLFSMLEHSTKHYHRPAAHCDAPARTCLISINISTIRCSLLQDILYQLLGRQVLQVLLRIGVLDVQVD